MLRKTIEAACIVAMLALAGCVSPAQRVQNQKEMNASVPICETDRQCKAEWEAAQAWVTNSCGMKIQTSNDSLIQTFNSPPDSPTTSCTVTKVPGPSHKFAISIRVGCANMFGCVPASKDQVIAFGHYVSQAGLPFQPLKVGAMMASVDSRGNVTQILAEGVGLKVSSIVPAGRAAAAGLQEGDVIKSLNGQRVRNEDDWQAFIANVAPGDVVNVGVRRAGQDIQVTMPL